MRLYGVGYISVGIIIGVIIATAILALAPEQVWSIGNNLGDIGPELIAASGGAALGGIISALVAAYSLNRTFQNQGDVRKAENKRAERATCNVLFSKLHDAQGELLSFRAHFEDDSDAVNMKFRELPTLSRPLFPQMHFWRIEPDELASAMVARDAELYNLLLDWKRMSSNLEFLSNEYARRMS